MPGSRGAPRGPGFSVSGHPRLSFCSNDYLGLAGHPALAMAAAAAAARDGFGASASRLVSGRSAGAPPPRVAAGPVRPPPGGPRLSVRYQTNLGVMTALSGPEDVIVSDALNHASIIDGCRLSRARIAVYPHGDAGAAARLLREAGGARRRLLVSESLFSMDGDAAPLGALAQAAADHDAVLVVDEAPRLRRPRSTGTRPLRRRRCRTGCPHRNAREGSRQRGWLRGGEPRPARAAGQPRAQLHLRHRPPPPVAAAALSALDIIDSPEGNQRRARLRAHAERLSAALSTLRPRRGPDTERPAGGPNPALRCRNRRGGACRLGGARRAGNLRPRDPTTDGSCRIRPPAYHALRLPRATGPRSSARVAGGSARLSAHLNAADAAPVRGLFVTGTDTGVGKTTISVALLRYARRRGMTPIPFKPAETGCDPDPADAGALWRAASPPVPATAVCLYALRLPAAPAQAAAAEGKRIDIERIAEQAAALAANGGLSHRRGGGRTAGPLRRRRDWRRHRGAAQAPAADRRPDGARNGQPHRAHSEGGWAHRARRRWTDLEPNDGIRRTARAGATPISSRA